MTITYHAKSPKDLAELFEEMARRAEAPADKDRPMSTRTLVLQREALTWRQAASIVRDTKFGEE